MTTTILCDTNVLSELSRREPDPAVLAWIESIEKIAISAVTVEGRSGSVMLERTPF